MEWTMSISFSCHALQVFISLHLCALCNVCMAIDIVGILATLYISLLLQQTAMWFVGGTKTSLVAMWFQWFCNILECAINANFRHILEWKLNLFCRDSFSYITLGGRGCWAVKPPRLRARGFPPPNTHPTEGYI